MRKRQMLWVCGSIGLVVLIIILVYSVPYKNHGKIEKSDLIISNYQFIDGLYEDDINLSDPNEVFRFLFKNLNEEVTVYPTENYFYFKFPIQGKVIGGSFSLSADSRDDGILGFGYGENREDPSDLDKIFNFNTNERVGGGGQYSQKDGVLVEKINDFKYTVSFRGKTVTFNLNDIGMSPPRKAKLAQGEIFVGPVFDESGLRFFLIFNKLVPHLYLVLNEDDYVPESFQTYGLYDNLLMGKRTKFVFYNDSDNMRKILVGVKGENVLQNNWYDGPFDQMPDNYIYTGQIPNYQHYLEASYFGIAGRVDKYGNYIAENGTRVAVAPYYIYFSENDFGFIGSCEAYSNSRPEFYNCITQQVYDVPTWVSERIYVPSLAK